MGVKGLLAFVGDAGAPSSAAELKGRGVRAAAVDAYCWMHRAAAASATVQGVCPQPLIRYCLKYINMLLANDIKPIMVFDGRHLPAKALTEDKRREARKLAKKQAAECLQLGKIDEAKKYVRQSIDITHEMALELIKECRRVNVDCIVAPYEADAQLAYLNKMNIVQVVITEDSDLILFGCTKIFFKMDTIGNGILYERAKLPVALKRPIETFSFDKFRQACILSGCDYLSSLPGIGLVKANKFIHATRDPDISNALRKMPSFFNKHHLEVTEEYRDDFLKAEATFKHQLVYDPIKRQMVPLNDIEVEGTDPKYCCNAGEYLEDDIAFQLALGNLDPFTLVIMNDWDPDNSNVKFTGCRTNGWKQYGIAPHKSVWSKNYSEHLNSYVKRENKINAISFPVTKPLKTKIINTDVIKKNDGLSIEDLSSMYCEKSPLKRKRLNLEVDVQENSTDRLTDLCDSISNDENVSEEKTSPILAKSSKTHRKRMEARLGLKRFSKFQRTTLDENIMVHSRFFDSPDDNNSTDNETGRMSDVSTDISVEISKNELIDTKLTDVTEPSSNNVSVISEVNERCSKNPFRILEQALVEVAEEENNLLENILTPPNSLPLEDDVQMEKETVMIKSTIENNTFNLKKSVSRNTCRKVGLSRKKSSQTLPVSQQMLTKFGFHKKIQLKHES